MKKTVILCLTLLLVYGSAARAGYGDTPPLHVEGRHLVDPYGNRVNLHGVGVQPNWYWYGPDAWGREYDLAHTKPCLDYFHRDFEMLTDASQGASANCIRLHPDPAWITDGNWDDRDPKFMNLNKLRTFTRTLFFPMAKDAIDHGMYVVIRPPGVFPYYDTTVGDAYNQYIINVFDILSQNDSIKKYSGQISFELGNEPINLWDRAGQGIWSEHALHDYFQPVVDKIRANGFRGVIWVPGTNYQQNYRDFVNCPVEDDNMGYAVHIYPSWYGYNDSHTAADVEGYCNSIHNFWPIIDTNPIIVTEVDWSPATNSENGHYNENGDWVDGNYGTWGTARNSHWGGLYKAVCDYFGNISTISLGAYLDNSYYRETGLIRPCYPDVPEACGYAFFNWFQEWSRDFSPAPALQRQYMADLGFCKYRNPIVNVHFPHVRLLHVGDTYFLRSDNEKHTPSVTLLMSRDLVNWQYCQNPEAMLSQIDPDGTAFNTSHTAEGCSVTTPDGQAWRIFNQHDNVIGDVVCLEPVKGGTKPYKVPGVGRTYPLSSLYTNDTFTRAAIQPQWQQTGTINVSTLQRPGWLRMQATAEGAQMVQRIMGVAHEGTKDTRLLYATIALDASGLKTGQRAGLSLQEGFEIAVQAAEDCMHLSVKADGKRNDTGAVDTAATIYLRSVINPTTGRAHFEFSTDNVTFQTVGSDFNLPKDARHGIFCTTSSGKDGYADIDWFSTEPLFSEERFYTHGQLKAQTEADVTATRLTARDMEILPGSEAQVPITAQMANGTLTNVAAEAVYKMANPAVAAIIDGRVRPLLSEGSTDVTATYTDANGTEYTATFNIVVSLFPLTEDCINPSIYKSGKYQARTKALTTGKDGFGGWQYCRTADLSRHRYLVVNLRRNTACHPVLRLCEGREPWAAYAEVDMAGKRNAVIDLSTLKKTDGTALNTTAIAMIGFQTDGSTALYIDSIFLSDDGVNPVHTAIQSVAESRQTYRMEIFGADGRRQSLRRGINIVRRADGSVHKVLVK